MKTIAVIGVGIMGNGIAANFLKHGYTVFLWNRTPEKLKALSDSGAKIATTPKEATLQADIIFEVTANDESSRAVWLGNDGILAGASPSKTLITSATLSTIWVDELAGLAKAKELNFFDMPLTGGRVGAENGKLTLLVGGNSTKLEELKPELEAISEKVLYFGEVGSGMRYKLVLNSLQAIHIAAFGEALRLATELGLDLKKVGDALAERPGGVITNLSWRDYQNTPDPINFSVEWIAKDLSYAKQSAKTTNAPILDEVLKKYKAAIDRGLAQKDWTEINRD